MNIVRWNNFNSTLLVINRIDDLFDRMIYKSLDRSQKWIPQVSVFENDRLYTVTLDIPGVEKKDVDVNLNNEILTVSGERKISEKSDGNNRIWHEATYGTFSRSFELTSDIVEDKIKANFKDGVLNITIPKAEEIKPAVKTIAVS